LTCDSDVVDAKVGALMLECGLEVARNFLQPSIHPIRSRHVQHPEVAELDEASAMRAALLDPRW
jgi:hypothetical protein